MKNRQKINLEITPPLEAIIINIEGGWATMQILRNKSTFDIWNYPCELSVGDIIQHSKCGQWVIKPDAETKGE